MGLFFFAAILFAIFSIGYLVIVAAILYHLNRYTLPGRIAPRIITKVFFIISGALWGIALYFLILLS